MSKWKVKTRVCIEEFAWVDFMVEADTEVEAIEKVANWEGEELDEYGHNTSERLLLDVDTWEVIKLTTRRNIMMNDISKIIISDTFDHNAKLVAIIEKDGTVYDIIDGHKIALNHDKDGVYKLKTALNLESEVKTVNGWTLNEDGNLKHES